MTDVDPSIFRQLCGRFTTGVAVVTTAGPDGQPVGMTANSFTSVSLLPPLVSVSIDRAAHMHTYLLGATRFAVNVLGAGQEALSRRFASEHSSRFDGVGYRWSESGLPILTGTHATIECETFATHAAGDHTIVIGRVVGGETGEGRPLVYYRGGYYDGIGR